MAEDTREAEQQAPWIVNDPPSPAVFLQHFGKFQDREKSRRMGGRKDGGGAGVVFSSGKGWVCDVSSMAPNLFPPLHPLFSWVTVQE